MTTETLTAYGTISVTGGSLIYDGNPVPFRMSGSMGYLSGSIETLINEWRGKFEDFAAWPITTPFTTDTYDEEATGEDLNPSDPAVGGYLLGEGSATLPNDLLVGSNWEKFWVSFVPPRKASFVVPKVHLGSVASTGYALLDAFQLSVARATQASELPAWDPAKMLRVAIRAVRVNRSINNSFEGPEGAQVFVRPGSVDASVDPVYRIDGAYSLKVQMTQATENYVKEDQLFEVTPGEYLAVSLGYRAPSLEGVYAMRVDFYSIRGNFLGGVLSPLFERTAFSGINEKRKIGVVAEVPDKAYFAEVYYLIGDTPVSGDVINIDKILIEKNTQILEYFDGDSSPSTDYLWRSDGELDENSRPVDAGSTWSYYYQDRILRHNIVVRTLKDNVPFGVTIDDPQYAVGDGPLLDGVDHPPGGDIPGGGDSGDNPDPNETGGYGYGLYGVSMPYGASYTEEE